MIDHFIEIRMVYKFAEIDKINIDFIGRLLAISRKGQYKNCIRKKEIKLERIEYTGGLFLFTSFVYF